MDDKPDPETGEIAPKRAPKSLLQTLAELQYGHFEAEGTALLREVITAVARTEKVGELTIKLKLKPGKGGQVEVFSDITSKLPKEEKGSTIMFISPELNLQRQDPRQMELSGLRAVETPSTALRQATEPAAALRTA